MIRSILTGILLTCLSPFLHGQNVNAIFEEATPLAWLGLDFTSAHFIGDGDKFSADQAIYDLMEKLNVLMIAEESKYSIGKTFKKTTVINTTDIATKKNKRLDVSSMLSDSPEDFKHLTTDLINEIVQQYDFEGKDGIGVMFNIESFDKLSQRGSIWITFIDMPAKKVLLTEQLSARPMGFGIRNYWAGCIHSIMQKIQYGKFKDWKKKYYHP